MFHGEDDGAASTLSGLPAFAAACTSLSRDGDPEVSSPVDVLVFAGAPLLVGALTVGFAWEVERVVAVAPAVSAFASKIARSLRVAVSATPCM